MKNTKTRLQTIYRSSLTGVILTVNDYLIEHKLNDTIDIKTTDTNDRKYKIADSLDVTIDASTSPIETIVTKEYSIF